MQRQQTTAAVRLHHVAQLVPALLAGWMCYMRGAWRVRKTVVGHIVPRFRRLAREGSKPALVWFRNDLRLHDHEPLHAAVRAGSCVAAVYCFDPREYGQAVSGAPKSGPGRTQFILESLAALRSQLRELGGELIVRVGPPEAVLPRLVQQLGVGSVHCHEEVAPEDKQVESRVRSLVGGLGAALRSCWGGTLHHKDDLPFDIKGMPRKYADFLQAVSNVAVRSPLPAPSKLKALSLQDSRVKPGELPTLQQLGVSAPHVRTSAFPSSSDGGAAPITSRFATLLARGGEAEALRALSGLVAQAHASSSSSSSGCTDDSDSSHEGGSSSSSSSSSLAGLSSRVQRLCAPGGGGGGLEAHGVANLPEAFSCQLSPWLAMGCLSARQVFHALQGAIAGVSGSADPGAMSVASWRSNGTSELGRREFFSFMVKAIGDAEHDRSKQQRRGSKQVQQVILPLPLQQQQQQRRRYVQGAANEPAMAMA